MDVGAGIGKALINIKSMLTSDDRSHRRKEVGFQGGEKTLIRLLTSAATPSACGRKVIVFAVTMVCLFPMNSKAETLDARGAQFVRFKSFSQFTKSAGANPGEIVLTSPEIRSRIQWNELIASWNVEMPTNTYLRIEARAIYPDHATKFYTMGLWSADPSQHPRESVPNQKDSDADVLTDTLALNHSAERFQLRVTLGSHEPKKAAPYAREPFEDVRDGQSGAKAARTPDAGAQDGGSGSARSVWSAGVFSAAFPAPRRCSAFQFTGKASVYPHHKDTVKLKFLGVSLFNSKTTPAPLSPNRAAWGKTILVPERSQMAYENGKALCSPATVSMLLAYWSGKLKRPELDRSVPEISEGVYDPNWPGTGNWAFNMAYAGSFRGMRAYVTRLSDVSELEDWITRGIPVGLSVCYNRLRGKSREPSGHVVVCCGFTENGDAIINDPGTSQNVRKISPRANLIDAWSYSKNTVYLLYPTNAELPKDKLGHLDSSTAQQGNAVRN